MKPSKYNYLVENDGNVIFFNGITEAFFCVSKGVSSIYETVINSPDAHLGEFGMFIKRMNRCGFVVDEDVDELESVKRKYLD